MAGNRPRKKLESNVIDDKLEYKQNLCTEKARHIENIDNCIELSIWYDKHYVDRNQFGDESGLRDGIDGDIVKNFVIECFKHLLYYSSVLGTFKFLSHSEMDTKTTRIILQKSHETTPPLNVAVEIHFIDFHKYEMTVKTAMCTESFKYFDGQYILEYIEPDNSVLKRLVKGSINEILNCQT